MSRARGRAPAKLNLGLRITGIRADGYHLLDSLFVPIDLADELELELREPGGVSLRLEDAPRDVPDDRRNLAVRAAERFAAEARLDAGIAMRLRKRVPAGAGLGGGSSDAATVLRLLDALCPGRIGGARLREIALALGADVPFFLEPRPARVRGIGDRIEPVDDLPALHLLLLHPGPPLATERVYRAYDEAPRALTPAGADPTLPPLSALRGADGRLVPGPLADLLRNDLEPPATRLCPAIAELRASLDRVGAAAVGLSGSGPTVYGVFDNEEEAQGACAALSPRPPVRSWVARTLTSAPALEATGASPNW